ncbi:MAG: ETC complex I subunit [Hyphomicrobiales bacterium]|nr:ETC complex I subunit [Hyphomicrobiales bacterium]MBV8764571.1 ETC complex I subunit [Hyphomicrobiales bacterium]MBV9431623.1 ETC complex I subunit [Hyphomicrobiales bacterium]MBV9739355.1 ETC complex I subunit [Hyphomicrobiales bacterium]
MSARIYRPARSAMQSGAGNTKQWRLEFEPQEKRDAEPLMGWTSSTDMLGQVRLSFDTKEEAIAFAKREGIAFRVEEPKETKRRPMSYSDNFRFNRIGQWTH